MFKPFLILNLITLKFYSMNKRIQKSQISIGLLMMCVIAIPALLFSSCKKKAPPVPAEIYYTVTFDSQGGSAVSPITGVKQGSTITLPANPTKAGFAFGGWCTDKEGKSSFSPTTPINSDLTLYAKWSEQFYTVTFDSQGGSAVNPVTGVKQGSTITLPANPTKAGFAFDGWCTDKEGKSSFSPTTPINSDLTLYAKWSEQFYTVTFDSQGGSAVNPITGVKYGSTITLPANPTKAGFTFGGWCTDKEGKSSFSPTTPINSDLTLYAKWNALPPAVFSLSSTSFPDGSEIPVKHFCLRNHYPEHQNISPQLSWTHVPKATTSFLIIMENAIADYPNWHVYNIPADKLSLAENDPWLSEYDNTYGYQGPDRRSKKDIDKRSTYIITIFALDLPPNYFKDNVPIFRESVENRLGSHILATASTKGIVTAKPKPKFKL